MLTFPLWNEEALNPIHFFANTNPVCASMQGLSEKLSCTYSTSSKELQLKGIVGAGKSLTTGTRVSFKVNEFKNPYSTAPVAFTIETKDGSLASLDSATAQILATEPAALREVSLEASSTELSAENTYTLKFNLGMPLDAGCRLRLTPPAD